MTTAHGTADGSGRFETLERHPFGVAGSAIVAMAAVISVFAPDLGSGSAHERLPLPGLLIWLSAGVALSQVRTTFQGSLGVAEERRLVAPIAAAMVTASVCITALVRRTASR